jgi:hypothetical protein
MIRTLTFVALLALVAGVTVGFFVAEMRAAGPSVEAPTIDPVLEQKVQLYVTSYSLSSSGAEEIRSALKDYNQGVLDLLRHLRAQNPTGFKDLSDRVNARIDGVINRKTK